MYMSGSDSASIGEYWREKVLTPYSRRALTKSTDKLVALSAAASRLQSKFGITYLAGLWKEDLIPGLLWYIERFVITGSRPPIRQESFNAPSWSWVSVDAPLSWHTFFSNCEIQEPLAQVLEAYTRPSTLDPFGPVSHGHIKLSAIARTAIANYDDADGVWTINIAEISGPFTRARFDTPLHVTVERDELTQLDVLSARRLRQGEAEKSQVSGIGVTAIPLIFARYDDANYWWIHGLILRESATRVECYERLGVFILTYFENDTRIRMMKRQEIIIV